MFLILCQLWHSDNTSYASGTSYGGLAKLINLYIILDQTAEYLLALVEVVKCSLKGSLVRPREWGPSG